MKKVLVFFANGTEEIEALTVVDILRRAGAEVTLAGVGGKEVTGSHAIRIVADVDADALEAFDYDMVVVPGGLPGTNHLDESKIVDKALSVVLENGGYLAAICAAPLVLGRRHYLVGKEATCYPGFEKELLGAILPDKRVCVDGHIITAAGMGVALAFSLALTEVLFGAEKANALRAGVLAD